jgi:hypothetical protein
MVVDYRTDEQPQAEDMDALFLAGGIPRPGSIRPPSLNPRRTWVGRIQVPVSSNKIRGFVLGHKEQKSKTGKRINRAGKARQSPLGRLLVRLLRWWLGGLSRRIRLLDRPGRQLGPDLCIARENFPQYETTAVLGVPVELFK